MRKWRKIVVDDVTWRYLVGRHFVVARSESGARICSPYADIIDLPPYKPSLFLDSAMSEWFWRGCVHITPSAIAEWIRKSK